MQLRTNEIMAWCVTGWPPVTSSQSRTGFLAPAHRCDLALAHRCDADTPSTFCALPSPSPAMVIFDLDFTLWHRPRFRSGPPFELTGDGSSIRASCGSELFLYPAAGRALQRLDAAGVPVAVASRTHRERWALEWLSMLQVEPGGRTVADVIGLSPVVIRDGTKSLHVQEIARRSAVAVPDMLFFDDNHADVQSVRKLGATSVLCPAASRRMGHGGLTDALFMEGLQRWSQDHAMRTGGNAKRDRDSRRETRLIY